MGDTVGDTAGDPGEDPVEDTAENTAERLEVLGGMLVQDNMKGTVESGSSWRFLLGVQRSL